MQIFLVGFMGSGKSHTAKRLSSMIGRPFVDLDNFIEKKGGQTISKLFEFGGEAQFRKIEQQALLEVIKDRKNQIVATGGGTPVFFDNMDQMKDNGLVIYLEASLEVIYNRIKRTSNKRPLLKLKSDEDLKLYIGELLEKRQQFYRQANLAVEISSNEVNPAEIIAEYLRLIMPDKFKESIG